MSDPSAPLLWRLRRLSAHLGEKYGISLGAASVVCAASVLPLLGGLLFRLRGSAAGAPLTAPVEWMAASLALVGGLFAAVRWRASSGRELEAMTLAFALPAAALLEVFQAQLPAWVAAAPGRLELAQAMSWNASRWFLALSLTGGLAVAWATLREPPTVRLRWLLLAASGAVGYCALALAAETRSAAGALERVLQRPWEIGPLFFFILAALLWALPIVARRGNGLNRGLLLSFIPQAVCQIEMLVGSTAGGQWQKLLAFGVVVGGGVADYASSQRGHESARQQRQEAEEELRTATAELEVNEVKRRQAEASLRMLAKAVETMSLGVTITDMDGRIVYVNPADARMHGYTVSQLMGSDSSVYASESALEGGFFGVEPWARERINRTQSGETFPVRLVSDRVRDEFGQPIATVTLCEDIRERIRIREALERRDRVLEAVAFAAERFLSESSWDESVGEVLARLGRATEVSCVYLDLIDEHHPFGADDVTYFWSMDQEHGGAGPDPIDLQRRRFLPARWEQRLRVGDMVSGRLADLPKTEKAQLEALGVGSVAVVPLFVRGAWAGYLCLESRVAGRDWSNAELEALRTASRTLAASIERRRDEEALATSEAKYRDLLENAHDLIQSVAPDGRFQFVNRAWKETLGYSDEEVRSLTIWQVVRPASEGPRRDVLQSMLVNDGQGRVEALFIAKDGREIAVEGVVTCRYQDGLPVAAQGIFRDISDRHAVDRMKQDFISTVSHELRTPLTSIIASLGLLDSDRLAGRPDRHRQLITVAHRNSNRLLKLINNLLDLQKLSARKMTFRRDAVSVRGLLEEAVAGIEAYAEKCDIRLQLERVSPELQVLGDRDRLMQVLNNLLSNAIKFSPAGEVVTVGSSLEDHRVLLTVADNGPGISDEFRGRLFDQFTQADPSKTRASGGSGLGLNIAKGFTEGMGGHLELETQIGRGTTFFVDLPGA
ncbi:MAG: PAS domain S-box protein [Acidobacteriota bacterium]